MHYQNFQKSLKKLHVFLEETKVMTMHQAEEFLKTLGVKEEHRTQLVKRLIADTSACQSGEFLLSSCNDSIMDFTKKDNLKGKINALFIKIHNEFDSINFSCKFPCEAILYNSKSGKALYIFYISENYADDCNLVEAMYSGPMTKVSPLNTVLIFNDNIDPSNVILSDNFNVVLTCQNNKFTSERK